MATAGSGDELKVLGAWASPFLVRVLFALQLKGLRYEYVEVDLKEKNELLLASNPVHKKIPVLLHAGKPVCESQLIVQYIDEAFPASGPSFLPADTHARAVARFWGAYVDDKVLSAELVEGDLRDQGRGGERGGSEADAGCGGRAGRGVPGVLRGETRVVRRRRRRVRGHRARWVGAVHERVGAGGRDQGRGPRQDAAAGRLEGPLLRARRGQGCHAAARPLA
ncbi:probable glutathione S-transferase GSTU6 isoform X2 [Brachypodium distachyon]|uniref:probable glutathione S-transferase GSTU6 isoform X2 n=1 Tax=Brachypodium distachyon TaxID=15368 RepID=UPI000D0D5431|nr:probable glutathione S-transferase GSTU6 isoform X2 [Brachypodium distachyon]|eukprot:XP_024314072.1 probable glutathione S-transferase GSTU6 isoform X2 [Brachypodium distachyon]